MIFLSNEKPKIKFIIITLVIIVFLTITTTVVSLVSYGESLKIIYSDLAYEIADYAETLLPENKLMRYADLAYHYNYGNVTDEEIAEAMNEPEYQRIKQSLDDLRKEMKINDIYIVAYDINVLKVDDAEAFRRHEWNPMYYIFDVYYAEDMRFPLGGKSRIVYDYRDEVLEACQRLERTPATIVTNGDWGNIISAILPLYGNGNMTVGIGIEIPMSVLDGNQNIYSIMITVAMGVTFIITLLLLLLFVISTMVNPVIGVINEPWTPERLIESDSDFSEIDELCERNRQNESNER